MIKQKKTREELKAEFEKLHLEISKKISLEPAQIALIRVCLITEKLTIDEIIDICKKKMRQKRTPGSRKRKKMRSNSTWRGYSGYRTRPLKFYKEIISFLYSASREKISILLTDLKI